MQLEKKNKLDAVILESVNKVQELGYTVLYAANYGSHNYNLDINNEDYQSDIDTKVIILPTLEELVNNTKPISTTIEISTGQCDIKDIRAFIPTLLKANIQFLEILCAKSYWINPLYKEDFQWFIDNLENLVQESTNELLKSIKGMCYEKRKALCHPYPTIKWKIDKWGYDGKQLHHIMRLKDFINSYFLQGKSFSKSIWYENDTGTIALLMRAKLNEYSLEEAVKNAEIYCGLVEAQVNQLTNDNTNASYFKEQYRIKANEIIINSIKRKVLEEENDKSNYSKLQ